MTLAQMVVALTDGADCLSDLAGLRGQQALFGPMASRATAQRAFDALGPGELAAWLVLVVVLGKRVRQTDGRCVTVWGWLRRSRFGG